MNKDLEVLLFRKIVTSDNFDQKYNDGKAWSRIYEYPLVMNEIKRYYKKGDLIHNTCWGFEGVHILFKEELEKKFENIIHSDIIKSDLKNTFIHDIAKAPTSQHIEKYDILINVSTLEEIHSNHITIFNNLFKQLKKGGVLIATFDLLKNNRNKLIDFLFRKRRRVLQIDRFENFFSEKISSEGTPINGENSILKNYKYKHLNCGIMVIKKI